jgi:hypothetical protein
VYVLVAVCMGPFALLHVLVPCCRFMIIADQRLRVANMSDTLNTNPYYFLQKRFKRLYFKFQPQCYYWWVRSAGATHYPSSCGNCVCVCWLATVPCRSLVILVRKFVVVIIGALVYRKAKFAAIITAVSLFVAFVLHKAYSPYRSGSALSDIPGGDTLLNMAPKKSKLKSVAYVRLLH